MDLEIISNSITSPININNINNINTTNRKVYVRCNIKKIDKINSVEEEFWCAFSITKYWAIGRKMSIDYPNTSELTNNLIIDEHGNLERSVKNEEPEIYISNLIKTNYKETVYDVVNINDKPFIEKTENYFAKLKGRFNFHRFPRDIQQLNINIIAKDSNNLVTLTQSEHLPSLLSARDTFQRKHEWKLYSPLGIHSAQTNTHSSTKNRVYSSLDFVFSIKRNFRNYFWNIVFLNFLIALISFTTYSIEYTNSADRLNVSGMLLLTKVAFKQVQNTLTPNISYLTLIDKYTFSGLAFLVIMMIQNSISVFMSQGFDDYSFIFLVGLFSVYNVIFSLRFFR